MRGSSNDTSQALAHGQLDQPYQVYISDEHFAGSVSIFMDGERRTAPLSDSALPNTPPETNVVNDRARKIMSVTVLDPERPFQDQ